MESNKQQLGLPWTKQADKAVSSRAVFVISSVSISPWEACGTQPDMGK